MVMNTKQERLSRLNSALLNKQQICSSEGVLCAFPSALESPFMIDGVGLVICRQGTFSFVLKQNHFSLKLVTHSFSRKIPCFKYFMHPMTWK